MKILSTLFILFPFFPLWLYLLYTRELSNTAHECVPSCASVLYVSVFVFFFENFWLLAFRIHINFFFAGFVELQNIYNNTELELEFSRDRSSSNNSKSTHKRAPHIFEMHRIILYVRHAIFRCIQLVIFKHCTSLYNHMRGWVYVNEYMNMYYYMYLVLHMYASIKWYIDNTQGKNIKL